MHIVCCDFRPTLYVDLKTAADLSPRADQSVDRLLFTYDKERLQLFVRDAWLAGTNERTNERMNQCLSHSRSADILNASF